MEIQILDWLQKLHTPVLDKIMCLITRLGDSNLLLHSPPVPLK